MARALIVVDMLHDFVHPQGSLRVPNVQRIIGPVTRELEAARAAGDTVIFACDSHDADDLEFQRYPAHAVTGTPGAEIIGELTPQPGERVVTKQRFSPFYNTELDALLSDAGITEATVVGVCTHICVMETVAGLANRDIAVRVPSDAVADIDDDMERAALKRMATVFNAKIS